MYAGAEPPGGALVQVKSVGTPFAAPPSALPSGCTPLNCKGAGFLHWLEAVLQLFLFLSLWL